MTRKTKEQNAARPKTPGRVQPGAELRNPPPRNAAEIIRDAARSGANQAGIVAALGISQDLYRRWLHEFPELKEALAEGREIERKELHNKLHEAAMNGNVTAAIFLLKVRHEGYIESGPAHDQANRVNITVNMPGALPLEKVIIENGTTAVQSLPNATADDPRGD